MKEAFLNLTNTKELRFCKKSLLKKAIKMSTLEEKSIVSINLSHDSREPVTIESLRDFVKKVEDKNGELVRDENADSHESVTWYFIEK